MTSRTTTDDTLADDILPSAGAISAFTGFDIRQTYHMLETGSLPGRRLKGKWIGSKTVLRRYLTTPTNIKPPETKPTLERRPITSRPAKRLTRAERNRRA
jgi:hypothetical protein